MCKPLCCKVNKTRLSIVLSSSLILDKPENDKLTSYRKYANLLSYLFIRLSQQPSMEKDSLMTIGKWLSHLWIEFFEFLGRHKTSVFVMTLATICYSVYYAWDNPGLASPSDFSSPNFIAPGKDTVFNMKMTSGFIVIDTLRFYARNLHWMLLMIVAAPFAGIACKKVLNFRI